MSDTLEQNKELAVWMKQMSHAGDIQTCARHEVAALEEKLRREKKRIRDAQHIRSVLGSVLHGWQEYRQHESPYYLVGSQDEMVLAEELLSPEEVALAHKKLIDTVPIKSVQHRACPTCGPDKLLPVIGICSSDDGDVSENRLLACTKCVTVHGPYSKAHFNRLFPSESASEAAVKE